MLMTWMLIKDGEQWWIRSQGAFAKLVATGCTTLRRSRFPLASQQLYVCAAKDFCCAANSHKLSLFALRRQFIRCAATWVVLSRKYWVQSDCLVLHENTKSESDLYQNWKWISLNYNTIPAIITFSFLINHFQTPDLFLSSKMKTI